MSDQSSSVQIVNVKNKIKENNDDLSIEFVDSNGSSDMKVIVDKKSTIQPQNSRNSRKKQY